MIKTRIWYVLRLNSCHWGLRGGDINMTPSPLMNNIGMFLLLVYYKKKRYHMIISHMTCHVTSSTYSKYFFKCFFI